MRHVANLRQTQVDVDPFDLAETRAILDAAQGWEKTFFRYVALWTGMRPGEALALRWPDIDWQHRLIMIRQTLTRRRTALQCPKRPDRGHATSK